MREIRFRAWNRTEQKMYHNVGIDPYAKDYSVFDKDGAIQDGYGSAPILMQFTGLRDRRGTEIYEDDIVIWDGGQYTVTFSTIEGWILKDDREDYDCPSLYGVSSPKQSRMVVIGNIYETPQKVGIAIYE